MTAQQATERIEALEAALYSGAMTVRHGDWTATYRSSADIRRSIADLRAVLAGRRPSIVSVATHSKGL